MVTHFQGKAPLSPVTSRVDAHRFDRRASPFAEATSSPDSSPASPPPSSRHLYFDDDFVDLAMSRHSSLAPSTSRSRQASEARSPSPGLALPYAPSAGSSESTSSDSSDASDVGDAAASTDVDSARDPSPAVGSRPPSPEPVPVVAAGTRSASPTGPRAASPAPVAVLPRHAGRLVLGSIAATLGAVALASHTRDFWQPSLDAALAAGRRRAGQHVVNPLSEALLLAGQWLAQWGHRPPLPGPVYNPLTDWHEIAERVQRLGVAIEDAEAEARPWLEPA